jgi:hypothetical protein
MRAPLIAANACTRTKKRSVPHFAALLLMVLLLRDVRREHLAFNN